MHILLVPSWYKSLKEPVLGTFFEEQARALMKAGHQVGVLYPQFFSTADLFNEKDEIEEFYADNGLPTCSMVYQSLLPKLRALSYKKFALAVEKYYLQYVEVYGTPDIIHTHSVFFGGIATYYIAKNYNIPLVITEHLTSFITGGIVNKEDRDISREIFTHADASIIVSNNFKKDIEKELKLPPDTFTVVHNMVGDIFFENFKIKTYTKGDEFIFFTNSFLLPRKNIKLILDSFKILINEGYNATLRIGGDGPLRDELNQYVSQLKISEQVHFLGAINRNRVKEETQNCHAFLLASHYETFGVVLIESFACGRPVVTTDSGGPRDFVDDSNGITVKTNDAQNFSEGMKNVISNYDNYNQKNISEKCFSLFNEKKIEGEIEQLYHTVFEKRKK